MKLVSTTVKKQNVIKILSYCVEMWLNNSKFQVIFSEVRVTTLKLWDKKRLHYKSCIFVVFKKIVDHFKYKLFKCVVVCWVSLAKLTGDSVYSKGSQAQKKFGNIFIHFQKYFTWNETKQKCRAAFNLKKVTCRLMLVCGERRLEGSCRYDSRLTKLTLARVSQRSPS